jgi:ubiquinone/menaquinone biosynthesis C-methylase UbiE
LIQTCQGRITGTFEMCDATYLQPVPLLNDKIVTKEANKFDVIVSFGVTQYLNNCDDAFDMLPEMFRVSKNKSTIYVGEISDLSKKYLAEKLRGKTHKETKKVSDIDTSHYMRQVA